MTQHLTRDEIAALAAGTSELRCAEHARACPECAAALEQLRTTLKGFATGLRCDSERPEQAWSAQRHRIASAAAARRSGAWRWALASATLVAVAMGLVISSPPAAHVSPPNRHAQSSARMTTDELFATISDELDRQSPAALDAAAPWLGYATGNSMSSSQPAGRLQGEQND